MPNPHTEYDVLVIAEYLVRILIVGNLAEG